MLGTEAIDWASDRILEAVRHFPHPALSDEEREAEEDIRYYRMRAEQELVRAELARHPKARAIHLALAAAYRHRASFIRSSLEAFGERPGRAMKTAAAA